MSDEDGNNKLEAASQADASSGRSIRSGASRRKIRGVVRFIKGVVTFVIVVVVLGAGGYAAYWFNTTEGKSKVGNQPSIEATRLVETVPAFRGDHRVRVEAMGTVMPAREAMLTPRVTGEIVEQDPSFVPGGFFEKGSPMLAIDRADYEQALIQRQSELASAEAELKIELGDQAVAQEELELLEVDIPEINRDLILRKPQVRRARASVESARAAVSSAELDLERTSILAPFDGQVVRRVVTIGNNVSAGDELATFVGANEYWVEIAVPVSSLRWIETPPIGAPSGEAKGSRAEIRYRKAWGDDAMREGRVARLVGELEPRSRLARVLISIEDPLARTEENRGKPAMILDAFVEVVIDGRLLEGVFVIDRDYVRNGDAVWVMGEDDRLVTRSVEVIHRGREVAYVRGLRDGDLVIKTNLQTPVEGMRLLDASGEQSDEGDGPPTIKGVDT